MSKYKIGDTVYGCYQRDGSSAETIPATVIGINNQELVILFENPYGDKDTITIHEDQVRPISSCHKCIHRLAHLSGRCEGSYKSI